VSEIIYRLGTEEDFPVIAGMYEKLDAYFRTLNLRLPEPEDVQQTWLDSFRRTLGVFSIVHIAELDGEVVGFMLARIKRVPSYWGGVLVGTLSDMWILEKARRMGVGDKLSRLALEWLREQGVHSVEIQVLEDNAASWKLYENMGFKPELRQARLLWDDYVKKDA
jgi:ribosomal protein S18 acetylase RimI-like enzyme